MQSYKVQFNDQIRRFSLPYESTYAQLRKKLDELFADVPNSFQIYYIDEENDKISINSQFEYDEAKRINKLIIRLFIETSDLKKTHQNRSISTTETSNSSAANSSSVFAQNSIVQTLLFIQPFITNPQLLKTVLPLFLSEINRNKFVSREDLEKINQHANQILDYPFVQEFLTKHLPRILSQITGNQPAPAPVPEPVRSTEKLPSEQIHQLFNSFMTFAQNVASNISIPNIPSSFTEPQIKTAPRSTESTKQTNTPIVEPPKDYMVYQPTSNINQTPPKIEHQEVPRNTREPTIFINELNQLKELGFAESNFLIELLNQSNGDINLVMDHLARFTY